MFNVEDIIMSHAKHAHRMYAYSCFTSRDLISANQDNSLLLALITKKRPEETQTLRAGCSKAEPKKFLPAADPLPGGAGPPKFNLLEKVTTCTYRPSLVRIDARNFELSW